MPWPLSPPEFPSPANPHILWTQLKAKGHGVQTMEVSLPGTEGEGEEGDEWTFSTSSLDSC